MDDLSTLGPLALGLLAWALGLAALMTRRTGLCAPSLGCCAVALSLVPLHVYLEVEAGDLSAIQDTAHAFALSAAALVLGTLALNAAAWLRRTPTRLASSSCFRSKRARYSLMRLVIMPARSTIPGSRTGSWRGRIPPLPPPSPARC